MPKIEPTVGRVVWYHPYKTDSLYTGNKRPLAAHVAFVHSEGLVNLMVIDSNGVGCSRTSVTLVQDGGEVPSGTSYCEWMPYQKGQAAKTEQAESVAEAARKGFKGD